MSLTFQIVFYIFMSHYDVTILRFMRFLSRVSESVLESYGVGGFLVESESDS